MDREVMRRGLEDGTRLQVVLSRLKRRGCVLLTGTVNEPVSVRVTRRLLGTPREPRKRILTLTDATADRVAARLPERISRVLRLSTALVRDVGERGHVPLPVVDDDPRVAAIDHLFDVRIDLRQRDAFGPEQRWHVPEYGMTAWVGL